MKPAPFEYHRVRDVGTAIDLLHELGDEAKVLAGGLSLVPMMNFRLARPTALIDINEIAGLDFVRRNGNLLEIGALTRHRAIETSADPAILDGYDLLPRAARFIGHFPIRSRGTFGGSVAHSDPSAEWCLIARLLDATINVQGPDGSRSIPASEWFTGFLTTAAEYDEVLTSVTFGHPPQYSGIAEFAQRKGDFAIASAAVAFDVIDGVCLNTAVVVGGVAAEPFRSSELEQLADGREPGEPTWNAIASAVGELISPPADLHGDAEYRRHLAATMISRAFADAGGPRR